MKRSFDWLVVIFALGSVLRQGFCSDHTKHCIDPTGEPGQCIPLQRCPRLMQLVRQSSISDESRRLLRESRCSAPNTGKSSVSVCCPIEKLPKPPFCGFGETDKIPGGQNAFLSEFPWTAIVEYRRNISNETRYHCGGTLISLRYVLTAAHCIRPSSGHDWEAVGVRLGEHNLDTPLDCEFELCEEHPVTMGIEKIIVHEGYSPQSKDHHDDIALIRLDRDVEFSVNVFHICLPVEESDRTRNISGLWIQSVGWGISKSGLLFVLSSVLCQTPAQSYNTIILQRYCQPSSRNVQSVTTVFRPLCRVLQVTACCNDVANLISSNPNLYLCSSNSNGYTFANNCKTSSANVDPTIVFRDDDTYYPQQRLSSTPRSEYRPVQYQTRVQPMSTSTPANGQPVYQPPSAQPGQTGTFQFNFGNPQDAVQVQIAQPGSSPQSNGIFQPTRQTQRPSNGQVSQYTVNGNSNDDDYNDDRVVVETGTPGYQATEFALNLFKNLDRPANDDTVLSPLLPQLLLSNLIDYASPVAKAQLKKTILLDPTQLASIVGKLDKISKSTVNTIETASANFVGEDVQLNNTYATDAGLRNVEVRRVNFNQPYVAARDANVWVSGKTHNLINEILSPGAISPYTRLLLANTIYFKGMWKYTFIESNPGKFESSPNSPRQLNKMFQLNKLRYGELSFPDGNGLRWVELPYEGNSLAMLVFLPKVRHQLEASIRQLKPYDLAKVMADLHSSYINTKVNLHMPKFTLTDVVSLIPALKRMGLHSIFQDPDALPYITNESIMVSDVTQRSYMSVDEFGTKATSVASLSIITLSITPQFKDVKFDVDQPFLTMIVDKQERYPLFIAQVNDPRE